MIETKEDVLLKRVEDSPLHRLLSDEDLEHLPPLKTILDDLENKDAIQP